jgi:hypothetical protein
MTRMGKMIHEKLSRAIIGIAMEVLNELKPGPDKVLFESAHGYRVAPPKACRRRPAAGARVAANTGRRFPHVRHRRTSTSPQRGSWTKT